MRYPGGSELPAAKEEANRKAIRLEWISFFYWLSALILIYFTLGQSQAMKAAWIEDILGLFPPIAFLIASRYRHRDPNQDFPWGYHRAITVAYVVTTVALFGLGLFIFIDSVEKLLIGVHAPIGLVEVFDTQVWLGWLMLGALLYSGIPPIFLGLMKRKLADELHDKVLFADAKMNQADWLTAGAAMVGVIGIGFGIWWADAVAAIVISVDILHDGSKYIRESLSDLMDEAPRTHDERKPHPLIDRVKEEVGNAEWVKDSIVRLREAGHLITGEVWVVPRDGDRVADRVEELSERIREVDWRVRDVVVAAMESIDGAPDGVGIEPAKEGKRA